MKREGRIHKGVSIGAYSILIAFMLLLLWTVLRYPGNHLIPWQMALGVAAATVLLLAAGAAWNKIYTVTGRRNSLYAVALVLFGVLLYVVSLSRQGNENTLLDYTYVYRDALNLANGRELEDTNYFLTYSNNLKPMLLLSVLFRMALLMDVSPYGSTGRHMEDHSDHTADRMRCDPLVAESVGGPSSDIAVWRFCRDSWSGSAALGQFLRDHKGSI